MTVRRSDPSAWVREQLSVELETAASPLGLRLDDLVGLSVRRNPRRAHLLVSRVLGKHVPTPPGVVRGAGLALGELVRRALLASDALAPLSGISADDVAAAQRDGVFPPSVVLGYAETATALGACVADALRAPAYLHSTRRPVLGVRPVGGFEEEHSHATSHLLLPEEPGALLNSLPLVLVDDELSTGTTALNTIAELHRLCPRARYVIAALVDLRSAADRRRMQETAQQLGCAIEVVALVAGHVDLPPDVLARGARLVERVGSSPAAEPTALSRPAADAVRLPLAWPEGVPSTARHGFTARDREALEHALPDLAAALSRAVLPSDRRVLVLGTEELMYAPLRLADALAEDLARAGVAADVRFSTTTRSPVLVVDEPGYAIRSRLVFPAHDDPADGPGPRFAYNVGPTRDEQPFDTVLLVVDSAGDTEELASGALAELGAVCGRLVVVVLPVATPRGPSDLPSPLRGPAFGSYAADEVGWLLKDLSDVDLEAPTEEREEAIQSGGAHYAESLPVEYQPSPEYQQMFRAALDASAGRVALAVGVVTELVLDARGNAPVLVSLARAGTPVGILLRRWAMRMHGLELPHYAVSIVRGRGIDTNALRHIARHHDPAGVMFVDGWTGKGAIARELSAALEAFEARTGVRFGRELAVLADPGSCVDLFGTREDYLIPSACLNSTVSGLVSRTVLNDALVGPGDFHGAKFYAGLADVDESNVFLDAVASRFADVAADVARNSPVLAAADRSPTWAGWKTVERISADYGIDDVNLVKPGVGETTRVLLRRVPWKVLVRKGAEAELGHVRLLAEQRGVPVEQVDDLPYSCVGLIHPRFTRGATGFAGTAAAR